MGRIVISTNATLDGIVQDPDGLEGYDRGGWFTRSIGTDREEWAKLATQEAMNASALLLGRRSDEWFATRWSTRSGEWANRLNAIPKYVVSTTLTAPSWQNATLLKEVTEVADLRKKFDGDIVVYASYLLTQSLLEQDLVDEIRLVVFPVIVGAGKRLFGDATSGRQLHLASVRRLGENLGFFTYKVTGESPAG